MSDLTLSAATRKLDVVILPQNWRALQLQDFCSFVQGGRFGLTKQVDYRTSGVPAYSAAGQDGYVDLTEFRNTDAVILSAIGANCGRCFIATGDWTTLANVQVLIPDPKKADARFLHYRVNRDDYWPRSGSAQPFIKPSDIKSCWIALPPVPQQAAVVQVLDTLDTAIHETAAIITKLKAVKQGLLHDLLTRGIDSNGELRPAAADAPHLYKESPLGWIPREWESLPLEKVTDTPICYGIVQVLGFVPNGVPVLAIRDLHGDFTTGIHRTSVHIDAAYPRSRVRPGDVLLSIKGTLGRVGVVPSHFNGNISRDIALIRPNPRVRSLYLGQMLQSTIGQQLLSLAQVGTTRGEISIAPLRRIVVPLPDVEEQQRLEASLEASEARIKQEELALQKLQFEKAGLMDDLLTGRVRVTALLNEAAQHDGSA